MAIDIATRFPRTTMAEALKRAAEQEKWIFPEFICSSVTLIYGQSNVGKSYLVSSMLLSLMVQGREFLGMQPTDPNKEWRPVVLSTDPGSDEEYAERIAMGIPEGVEVEVPTYFVGITKRADEWEALTDHLFNEGHNFVVLDNLIGAAGDMNDTLAVSTVFDGLNRLVARGVPVVVLSHETEHSGSPRRGAPPMGTSAIVQKSRVWIQARQTKQTALRGGNLGLYVQSNKLDQPYDLIAKPGVGPTYSVVATNYYDENGEPTTKRQTRDKATMDQTAKYVDFVIEDCQGLSNTATADKIAERFGGSANTYRTWLSPGKRLGALVEKVGDRWEPVAA